MGKTIDVSGSDGKRVFADCLERAARLRPFLERSGGKECRIDLLKARFGLTLTIEAPARARYTGSA